MKCVLAAAISKDGFLTKGYDPNPANWTSIQDQELFNKLREQHNLFVFGSTTYLAIKPQPVYGKLKVVLTSNPDKYAPYVVPGLLEFHSLSAKDFVKKYQDFYSSCLILGGSHIYAEFLKANLVDEAYVTVEPVMNKTGVKFFTDTSLSLSNRFKQEETTKINAEGTALVHYRDRIDRQE